MFIAIYTYLSTTHTHTQNVGVGEGKRANDINVTNRE